MALSEIEKLERRYAENPQGLTFAPLAEVHRKNGDVTRALELLRPGLTLHPDYIPASIVLGRCHLDLGDLPASEAAFTHVFGLDGENVIALKALADITERQGRFDEAERWLRTLLEIDRSNDEARDQLGRVESARRQTESSAVTLPGADAGSPAENATTAESVSGPSDETPPESTAEAAEEHAAADPSATSLPASADAPLEPISDWASEAPSAEHVDTVPLDLKEIHTSGDLEGIRPEGIELEQPVSLEDAVEPLAGLVGRDATSGSIDSTEDAGEFRVEMAEDIVLNSSGGREFQVANAAEELLGTRGLHEIESPVPEAAAAVRGQTPDPSASDDATAAAVVEAGTPPAGQSVTPEMVPTEQHAGRPPAHAGADAQMSIDPAEMAPSLEQAPQPAAPEPEAAEAPAPWSAPLAEPPRQPEPELVVTESMAELLLQQGHVGEALIVYRHLESRGGGAHRFREKIAELERAAAEATLPSESATGASESAASEPAASEPAPAEAPPARAYSVQVTRGRSVQGLLRNVLAGRPPAMAAGPAVHGANQKAGGGDVEGAPTRPAHDSLSLSSVFGEESTPTPPAVPAAGAPGTAPGGVSYDEFFGASGGAGAPSNQRPARAPDPKGDDLDQFHAWLQNLKR
jgi:tetratricopeptide (TPR) repeat protein